MTHDGLLIDFGGVMTTNVFESFAAFCRAEGLDPDTVKDRFRNDRAARDLLGELEEGKLSNADFEARFAAMLGVADHEGLIARLFGGMQQDEAMFDAVAAARRAGIRKPAPEIYALAAERLGRPPERCVFVDDLPGNLKPAAALGMATVLHRDAGATIPRLEALLGVSLR